MKKFNFEKFGFYRNIFFIGFFALFLCLLLFAITFDVHASSYSSNLPYLVDSFDNWSNYDGYTFSELQEFYNNRWGQYYPLNWSGPIFAYEYSEVIGAWGEQHFTVLFVPSISNANYYFQNSSNIYSQFDVNNDYITFTGVNYGIIGFSTFRNRYNDPDFSGISTHNVRLFSGGQIPIACSSNFYFNKYESGLITPSDEIIFGPWQPSTVITGHATQPNNNPNNLINGSNNNPIARPTRPTPTPFTPSVWNPPSLDTSSIETLLESIWECLEYGFNYLKNNLSGWFSNLLSNLDSWFGYLVDSIFYTGNKIVQSIQDLATDLYNNFVSLFEPFFDFLASVVSFFDSLVALGTDENGNFSLTTFVVKLIVPDPDDLASTLLEADVFGIVPLFNAVKTFITSFFSTIFNLQVSKVFTIPSFTAFGTTFPSYQIDFSWFDYYKNYSDAIISAFLVIGYAHWFFIQLAPMLRGGGVVGHDQSTDASKKVGG